MTHRITGAALQVRQLFAINLASYFQRP